MPVKGAGEVAVLDAIESQRFAFAGVTRTYSEFCYGFAIAGDSE